MSRGSRPTHESQVATNIATQRQLGAGSEGFYSKVCNQFAELRLPHRMSILLYTKFVFSAFNALYFDDTVSLEGGITG